MKKSLITLLGSTFAVLLCLSGCGEKEKPVVTSANAALVSTAAASAEVVLTTSNLSEYAYLVFAENETPEEDPAVLFVTGNKGALVDGENTVVIRGLEANSSYVAVIALRNADKYWDEVFKIEITTTDWTEPFTLIDTYPDGFKAHFMVPQSVKEAGHALRFNVGSLPMYINGKYSFGTVPEADMLIQNTGMYFMNDTTFVYNADNAYLTDENGDLVVDEWGEHVQLHTYFAPGEPIVFTIGEFEWGESPYGWDEGWYVPCFDYEGWYASMDTGGEGGDDWGTMPLSADVNDDMTTGEDEFWTGYYLRRIITTRQPEKLDGGVKIDTNIGAVDGTITLTPDENVTGYCYAVLDEGTYQQVVDTYLLKDENLVQWFITSEPAMYLLGTASATGITELSLKDVFYEVSPEMEYRVLVTAMGNEDGTLQSFQEVKFSTIAKTHPAPTAEVKAIANPNGKEDPYQVWFNVKCPSKNATSGIYVANYEREWKLLQNSGNTIAQIIAKGNGLSANDIAAINSDEGLNMMFTSMAGQTMALGVLLYNDEDTPNEEDAYATSTTIDEPAKTPVESKYYTSLLGDWTMTSTFADGVNRSTKVSILNGFSYPETLDQSVYDTYKEVSDMDKAAVDALFKEFKQEVDEYNAWLKSQNLILCYGYGFDSNAYQHFFTAQTPFDLFCSKTYTGLDNASMIWDCGPKWYLEVLEDGSVAAPINDNRFYPLAGHSGNALYAIGYNANAGFITRNTATGGDLLFPATVAADNNTITVNGLKLTIINNDGEQEDVDFYLNALTLMGGSFPMLAGANVTGALVLTRGWAEAASVSQTSDAKPATIAPVSGNKLPSANVLVKGKTPMSNIQKVNRVDYKCVSFEEAQQRMKEHYGRK